MRKLRNAVMLVAVMVPLGATAHGFPLPHIGAVKVHLGGGGGGGLGGFGSLFKGLGHAFDFMTHVVLRVTGQAIINAGPPVPAPQGIEQAPVAPYSEPIEVAMQGDAAPTLKDRQLEGVPAGEEDDLRVRGFLRSFYTLVGGPAWDAKELQQQDGLVDPAQAVSDDIATALVRNYALAGDAPAGGTSTGLVMRVTTTHWEMKSVSINPLHLVYGMTHYGVYYHATFTLMDRRDGAIVASGDCDVSPEVEGAPTYSETMAQGGARLKDMLASDAAECAADIESDYLGIDTDADQAIPPYPL